MTEKRIFISQDTFLAFPTEKSMKILILINDPNQIFSFFNISKSAQSNCYDTNHWQIPGNIFFMLNQAKVSGYILLKYQVTQKMLLSEVITFFGTPCTLYHMYVCYTLYLLFFPHDFLFCNFFSALLKQEKKVWEFWDRFIHENEDQQRFCQALSLSPLSFSEKES